MRTCKGFGGCQYAVKNKENFERTRNYNEREENLRVYHFSAESVDLQFFSYLFLQISGSKSKFWRAVYRKFKNHWIRVSLVLP